MSPILLCRRQFGATATVAGLAAGFSVFAAAPNATNVTWLAEIQSPPENLPTTAPKLRPLLLDEAGNAIQSEVQWRERAAQLRQAWLTFLGPAPAPRKPAPELEVLQEETTNNIVRRLIRYEVEPGVVIEAYWIAPAKSAELLPGAVVFHSTTTNTIRQPAGLTEEKEKAFGLKLAEQGFVTVSPRNFLWTADGKNNIRDETNQFLKSHPGITGMRRMLHDAQVAVDVLLSLPGVDKNRICSVGHSLGAKEVLYLAAFDERVKCTVSSEGGIGLKFSNWDALWYLGERIKAADFPREHHELLGLIAPRAFLLVGGDSADGDRGWPFIQAALPVYTLTGRDGFNRIGQYNHKKGHAVPPQAEQRIYEWLKTYT